MTKKKNKIKLRPATAPVDPYQKITPDTFPWQIKRSDLLKRSRQRVFGDEVPNATPVSQLLKPPPYDPVKIFIVPVRVSIRDLLSCRALTIAIALTSCAAAIWLGVYIYMRINP